MAYFINLFSPDTYEAFLKSDQTVSGFRRRQENAASKIKVGDKLICYITKLSRWFGVMEVLSTYYIEETPLFYAADDPFIIRFKIKPLVWLPVEKALPVHTDQVWNHLSFTRKLDKGVSVWTGKIRNSLNALSDQDGRLLEKLLLAQQDVNSEIFELDRKEYERHLTHKVRGVDKELAVSVPQDVQETVEAVPTKQHEIRESIQIQALLARTGAKMGLNIWLPRNDRTAVTAEWKPDGEALLDLLPLNYDEATLKTIEQIDVIWLKGRSIVRAFEVEHTTSIYSGILRMADLLALQPNMNIRLHIVAPYERRDKVFQEIRRPVFSFLDAGPLAERCTYLSYDSVREIAGLKHLAHLADSVLDEYAEDAE